MKGKQPENPGEKTPEKNSFLVSVHRQDHQSWQGSIQWLETGQKVHFRSALEMMTLIDKALNSTAGSEKDIRNWNLDRKRINAV